MEGGLSHSRHVTPLLHRRVAGRGGRQAAAGAHTAQKKRLARPRRSVPIADMFNYFQQLCSMKSGSTSFCHVVFTAFHCLLNFPPHSEGLKPVSSFSF